jgi:antitoxin component HigA of HigAB toxin-antitoxin module
MATRKRTRTISPDAFPAWLRSRIEASGMTITDFAESIGFGRQRISNVLSGRESPGSNLVAALKPHGLVSASTVYEVKG